MAVVTTYTCDVCGKQRGEANHWFKWVVPDSKQRVIAIMPWDATWNASAGVGHLCGPACAQRKLQECLEECLEGK